jgi:hypothetical protein
MTSKRGRWNMRLGSVIMKLYRSNVEAREAYDANGHGPCAIGANASLSQPKAPGETARSQLYLTYLTVCEWT